MCHIIVILCSIRYIERTLLTIISIQGDTKISTVSDIYIFLTKEGRRIVVVHVGGCGHVQEKSTVAKWPCSTYLCDENTDSFSVLSLGKDYTSCSEDASHLNFGLTRNSGLPLACLLYGKDVPRICMMHLKAAAFHVFFFRLVTVYGTKLLYGTLLGISYLCKVYLWSHRAGHISGLCTLPVTMYIIHTKTNVIIMNKCICLQTQVAVR